MTESLFLIDSSALAYRSYYAFIKNPLTTSLGEETSAVFGFASQVLRLIQEESPTHIVVVQDLPAPTFRHKLYEAYKATRKPMPQELRGQLPIINQFIDLANISVLSREGFEADDIMGTLALRAQASGMNVYMVTKDKDMMQVVGQGVYLYDPGVKNQPPEIKGIPEVQKKFDVSPGQIVDLLALMGDSSDNVPGVTKVGQKTAAELLKLYGSLEGIYDNLDNITRKALRTNLTNDREKAFLSRELVTLDCDVPLGMELEAFRIKAPKSQELAAFFKRWELFSLIKLIPGSNIASAAVPADIHTVKYTLADTSELLNDMGARLSLAPLIALDTETDSLDTLTARLAGVCVSCGEYTGWYVPLTHEQGHNVELKALNAILNPLLANPEVKFIFQNAKFDLPILARHGFAVEFLNGHRFIDTMVAAHLVNPGVRGIGLSDLALSRLGRSMIPIESLLGKKGKDQITFPQVPPQEACNYGAEDADVTFHLWAGLKAELESKELMGVFSDVEIPLLPVLQRMEATGICLDEESMHSLSQSMAWEIESLKTDIIRHAGGINFNINSPQQLGKVLFENLGLSAGKKTQTGYSTDIAVLTKLKGKHPIIECLINYRELAKLKNTYVDVLPSLVHPVTARVHTSYSQVIAATGRLSSVNPNLQNIPIRTSHGKDIRRCFIAKSPEYVLMAADYSQIELRILAHLSGDPGLCRAYQNGLDIHTQTAAALYGVEEPLVTGDMRRSAKAINFGVIYGMGPRRLSRELGVGLDTAEDFIKKYFTTYHEVNNFKQQTVEEARKCGYVKTILGRRRYLPDLASNNRMHKENAERMAVNTPIQGSAADLIKLAMIALHKELATSLLDCTMLLQVHDELVFEVSKKDADAAASLIKSIMEQAMILSVPLAVDIGCGTNWLEAHE